MRKITDGEPYPMPAKIENPTILSPIGTAYSAASFGRMRAAN